MKEMIVLTGVTENDLNGSTSTLIEVKSIEAEVNPSRIKPFAYNEVVEIKGRQVFPNKHRAPLRTYIVPVSNIAYKYYVDDEDEE